jgi:tryptophan synthase alpha chain
MAELDRYADGFIYCVARRGVTGARSKFDDTFSRYLRRCRKATRLPIAVGFGIRDRTDIEPLVGKADMAVIGSETIRLVDGKGAKAVGAYISSLLRDI